MEVGGTVADQNIISLGVELSVRTQRAEQWYCKRSEQR